MKRLLVVLLLAGCAGANHPLVPQTTAAGPSLGSPIVPLAHEGKCHTRSVTYTEAQLWSGGHNFAKQQTTYRAGYGFFSATVANNLDNSQLLVTWGTGRPGGSHKNSGYTILKPNTSQSLTFADPVRKIAVKQRHHGFSNGSGVALDIQSCPK